MFCSHSSVWSLTMCSSQCFPKYPPDLRCPCLIPKDSLYQASRRGSSLGREEKCRQPVREGFQVGTQTRRGSATSSALKPQKRTQRLLAVRGYGPRAARLVKLRSRSPRCHLGHSNRSRIFLGEALPGENC